MEYSPDNQPDPPSQRADLHVHTTASDGTLSPDQAVRRAAEVGLSAIGIADHDTTSGIPSALIAGLAVGITVVPAVEINTDFGQREVHILGYYVDTESPYLNEQLLHLQNGRRERGLEIVRKLNEMGVSISVDRISEIADGTAVGRPHIARAIVEAGFAKGMGAAFGKYLVRGTPAYVPRIKLAPEKAVEIILRAGGVPVLAHPGINKQDEIIPMLVDAGLKGLEVYHTEHSRAQTRRYKRLAARYGLIPTGGSDSHGPENVKTVEIGSVTVDMDVVYALHSVAGISA